mgnify:CR=1 FL=1
MANHPYSSTPAYQPDDNWRASALCAQTDPALFFPDGRRQHQRSQTHLPNLPSTSRMQLHCSPQGVTAAIRRAAS